MSDDSPFEGIKKGALRQQIGVPKDRTIPVGLLERISDQNIGTHVRYRGRSFKITPKLKKRAVWALTFAKRKQ